MYLPFFIFIFKKQKYLMVQNRDECMIETFVGIEY